MKSAYVSDSLSLFEKILSANRTLDTVGRLVFELPSRVHTFCDLTVLRSQFSVVESYLPKNCSQLHILPEVASTVMRLNIDNLEYGGPGWEYFIPHPGQLRAQIFFNRDDTSEGPRFTIHSYDISSFNNLVVVVPSLNGIARVSTPDLEIFAIRSHHDFDQLAGLDYLCEKKRVIILLEMDVYADESKFICIRKILRAIDDGIRYKAVRVASAIPYHPPRVPTVSLDQLVYWICNSKTELDYLLEDDAIAPLNPVLPNWGGPLGSIFVPAATANLRRKVSDLEISDSDVREEEDVRKLAAVVPGLLSSALGGGPYLKKVKDSGAEGTVSSQG